MNKTAVKYYFPLLDILRFFAAVSVLIYHCIEHYGWHNFPQKFGLFWFRMGWIGVDLFFVLSGFVISLAAFTQLDNHGTHNFRLNFMKKRAARIMPLHYLTMLIFIIFLTPALIYSNFIPNLLSHLFFVHNLSYITHSEINGVNWSLGAEMQFYLLIALLAPFIKDCRIYKVVIPALIVTFSWRLFVTSFSKTDTPLDIFHFFIWATQLPGMLDEFLIGFLLARLVRSPFAHTLFNYKYTSLLLLALAIVMMTVLLKIYLTYSSFWQYPFMVIFFRSYIGLTFGVILLFLCTLRVNKPIKMILSPLMYGGTISYGLYLWHLPVILSVKAHLGWLSPEKATLVTLAFTLTLAILSWHFFEKRFLIRKV